jgi:hypothetical protein
MMMKTPIVLIIMTALGIGACYRTSGSSNGVSDVSLSETSDEGRCGETTFIAYLASAELCFAQSLPRLPGYESIED